MHSNHCIYLLKSSLDVWCFLHIRLVRMFFTEDGVLQYPQNEPHVAFWDDTEVPEEGFAK